MTPEPSKPTDQREALRESQRDATDEEPANFQDESTERKVVEIGPDKTDDPIHGIDPPDTAGPHR